MNSPFYIPSYIQNYANLTAWDTEAVISAQQVMIDSLKTYWVPLYILNVKNMQLEGEQTALFSLARKELKKMTIHSCYPYVTKEVARDKSSKKMSTNNPEQNVVLERKFLSPNLDREQILVKRMQKESLRMRKYSIVDEEMKEWYHVYSSEEGEAESSSNYSDISGIEGIQIFFGKYC